jgi:hypothetical protein
LRDRTFWDDFCRIQLDGKWLSESGCKYHFYSEVGLLKIIRRVKRGEDCHV